MYVQYENTRMYVCMWVVEGAYTHTHAGKMQEEDQEDEEAGAKF